MQNRFRSGKASPVKGCRVCLSAPPDAFKKIAWGTLSFGVLLLILNAAEIYTGLAFAAPSEMETNSLFHRAALKLNTTGKLVIIAFGTSSTQGAMASSAGRAYPAILERYLNLALGPERAVSVFNRGIGGQDVETMMARLERDVLRDMPDIVIWQTGTNDPLHHVLLTRFVEQTRKGIRQMQDAGIAVVLMDQQYSLVMAQNSDVLKFRDAIRIIGEEMRVPVIKRYDMTRKWLVEDRTVAAEIMSADGLHMADEGYRRLAEEVAAELIRDLAVPASHEIGRKYN